MKWIPDVLKSMFITKLPITTLKQCHFFQHSSCRDMTKDSHSDSGIASVDLFDLFEDKQ